MIQISLNRQFHREQNMFVLKQIHHKVRKENVNSNKAQRRQYLSRLIHYNFTPHIESLRTEELSRLIPTDSFVF